jgi:hypothetical protein
MNAETITNPKLCTLMNEDLTKVMSKRTRWVWFIVDQDIDSKMIIKYVIECILPTLEILPTDIETT